MQLLERATASVRGGLAALLLTTDKGRKIAEGLLAEQETQRLARRAALASERADLRARELAEVDAYTPKKTAADAEIARRRKALDDAIAAAGRLHAEHVNAIAPLQRRCDRIDAELRLSASPLIEQFCAALREDVPRTQAQHDAARDWMPHGGYCVVWSNEESIRRRTEAIFETVRAAGELVYEPLDDEALQARLDEMRAALPDVEERPAKYRGESDAV